MKRNCRQERRYHTADTLDTIKRDINKDSNSIQKRFSWNYSGQNCGENPAQNYRLIRAWPAQKCHSSESIHSSSGVSSSCSAQCSASSDTEALQEPSVADKVRNEIHGGTNSGKCLLFPNNYHAIYDS